VGGGAGMAPILSVLRSLAEKGSTRNAAFYYGARRRQDLCFEDELARLRQLMPGLRFVPALSEPDSEPWDGEVGLITDVVKRHEEDLTGADCYVCGPPPMVEAAMQLLEGLGAEESHIYYDKFTTTGATDATGHDQEARMP
jgi:propane monooxygenase reductase component